MYEYRVGYDFITRKVQYLLEYVYFWLMLIFINSLLEGVWI